MKYRTKIEIVADMLSVAKDGAKKTHIMYRGNLSYKLLNAYLGVIVKTGLLSCDEDSRYRLTEKGKAFLRAFSRCNRRAKGLEKQLWKVRNELATLERQCSAESLPNNIDPLEEQEANSDVHERVQMHRKKHSLKGQAVEETI